MAARAGIEPTTLRLKVIDSTNAPPRPVHSVVVNRFLCIVVLLHAFTVQLPQRPQSPDDPHDALRHIEFIRTRSGSGGTIILPYYIGSAPIFLRDFCCLTPGLDIPAEISFLTPAFRAELVVPFARTSTKQRRAFSMELTPF